MIEKKNFLAYNLQYFFLAGLEKELGDNYGPFTSKEQHKDLGTEYSPERRQLHMDSESYSF